MKEQIYKICTQLNDGQIAVTEATEQLLDLFAVSGSVTSIETLDDENSEIHKIGHEIAEMSDEAFENNCKKIEKILSKSKGNDR